MKEKANNSYRNHLEHRITTMLIEFFNRNGYHANYIQIDRQTYLQYFSEQKTLNNTRFIIIDVDYQSIAVGTDDIDGIIKRYHNRNN